MTRRGRRADAARAAARARGPVRPGEGAGPAGDAPAAGAAADGGGPDETGFTGRLVVLGASWGGLQALSTIVHHLSPELPAAVAIVQHRSKDSGSLLAELLQDVTPMRVVEPEDKEPIVAGHAYVAPPDYHLLVDDGMFSLSVDAAFRYSRPSIDVTMASAAEAYGERVVAVVLTGANDDGARGARQVIERGGAVLVQDPETAEVRTMPEAAMRALATAPRARWAVVPLDAIGARLVELVAGAVGMAGGAT
jgi:two-component system, chemotaxis family, protein-glutamate methylesterase/glutaminase